MNKFIYTFFLILFFLACKKDKTVDIECKSTQTISFSQQILPLVVNHCAECHDNDQSPVLNNHQNISENALKMLSRMKGEGGALMPKGGPALNDSLIDQFSCWVVQGKKNN
jgi:hypothetical protein